MLFISLSSRLKAIEVRFRLIRSKLVLFRITEILHYIAYLRSTYNSIYRTFLEIEAIVRYSKSNKTLFESIFSVFGYISPLNNKNIVTIIPFFYIN